MKNVGLIFATAIVVFFTFEYLYPLKLLVVFFHESSHALMTLATGGEVVEFVVNPNQSGHVLSRGGSRFLTLSAGYLGSLIWGLTIFYAAAKSDKDSMVLGALAVLIVGVAIVFSNDMTTLSFSAITGFVMVLIAKFGGHTLSDITLRIIGMTSIMYVPIDIWSDTIVNSGAKSDAWMLADEIGGTGEMWGMVWITISAILILFMTVRLIKEDNNERRKTIAK